MLNKLPSSFINLMVHQGRNQLGAEAPPVKSWAPSKMWLLIVIARRKREKRVFSLAQYYHNTSKVSWVIIKATTNS